MKYKEMYLYIIKQFGGSGLIKIGVSTDVESRIKALQTGNGCPLTIVAKYKMNSPMLARNMERRLHEYLNQRKSHGEWFFNGPWVDKLVTLFNKHPTFNTKELETAGISRYSNKILKRQYIARIVDRELHA